MEQIESLTDELLAAAEAENWDKVVLLESERRPLIEDYFSNLPENRRQALQARVEIILEKDKRVMALARECHHVLGKALNKIAKGKTAVKAYENQR